MFFKDIFLLITNYLNFLDTNNFSRCCRRFYNYYKKYELYGKYHGHLDRCIKYNALDVFKKLHETNNYSHDYVIKYERWQMLEMILNEDNYKFLLNYAEIFNKVSMAEYIVLNCNVTEISHYAYLVKNNIDMNKLPLNKIITYGSLDTSCIYSTENDDFIKKFEPRFSKSLLIKGRLNYLIESGNGVSLDYSYIFRHTLNCKMPLPLIDKYKDLLNNNLNFNTIIMQCRNYAGIKYYLKNIYTLEQQNYLHLAIMSNNVETVKIVIEHFGWPLQDKIDTGIAVADCKKIMKFLEPKVVKANLGFVKAFRIGYNKMINRLMFRVKYNKQLFKECLNAAIEGKNYDLIEMLEHFQ